MTDCISIVIPVYNASQYLDKCITSILNQDYSNIEVILVNDGSSDNSLSICQKYAELDERIKYFDKPNGGVSSARNYGIEQATGRFICFIDSDDYVDSDFCSKLFSKFSEQTKMVVLGLRKEYSNYCIKVPHRLKTDYYNIETIKKIAIDDGTLSGFTFHSSCSILFDLKTILVNNIRFNESLKYNEDGLFTTIYILSLIDSNVYVNYSDTPYIYRVNDTSATNNVDLKKYSADMKQIEKYITNNYKDEIIINQIKKRTATVSLSYLLLLKKCDKLTYLNVKTILKSNKIHNVFNNIQLKKLGLKKSLMILAIKFKLYGLIYFILHFI